MKLLIILTTLITLNNVQASECNARGLHKSDMTQVQWNNVHSTLSQVEKLSGGLCISEIGNSNLIHLGKCSIKLSELKVYKGKLTKNTVQLIKACK